MKKVIFLFSFMLAIALPAWSQLTVQSMAYYAQLPGSVEKTIIRELQFPASISYVETNVGHYFVYHDGDTNGVSVVEINSFYSVNDLVIDNDSVFFCGEDGSGRGFIGHFYRVDFFGPTKAYSITNTAFGSVLGAVTSFDKMVTFIDNNIRKVAAIGRVQQYYCVAEIAFNAAATVCHYSVGTLNASSNESLLGIALTNNHVVTVGFQNAGVSHAFCIRAYMRSNMFANNGPQNTVSQVVSTIPAVTQFDASQIVVSCLENNIFALAAYYKGPGSSLNQGTVVGVFFINNNNNSINYFNSLYIPQDYINGGWTLRGITGYDNTPYPYSFYLLQNADIDTVGPLLSMIFEMNYAIINISSSTNIGIRFRPDPMLQSIDANSGSTGYVTNGNYLQPAVYGLVYMAGKVTANGCYQTDTLDCFSLNITKTDMTQPIHQYTGPIMNFQSNIGSPVISVTDVQCFE